MSSVYTWRHCANMMLQCSKNQSATFCVQETEDTNSEFVKTKNKQRKSAIKQKLVRKEPLMQSEVYITDCYVLLGHHDMQNVNRAERNIRPAASRHAQP